MSGNSCYSAESSNKEIVNMLNDLGKQVKNDTWLIDYILYRYRDIEEINALFRVVISRKKTN